MFRSMFLRANHILYARLVRPLLFRASAQTAHDRLLRVLRWADGQRWLLTIISSIHRAAFRPEAVTVGGVRLSSRLILAAGLVKGDGFEDEPTAWAAVTGGQNIIPGWRCLPRLVGLVEFGSFTRWSRQGNPGTVMWRDVATRSSQNRVGLRNPGVMAAAAFLEKHRDQLPEQFGINIAISPGLDDMAQQTTEILDALAAFIERGVHPTWFTLNVSCPNTEDDPTGNQTAAQTRHLCRAVTDYLNTTNATVERAIPLWIKIGPTLSVEQYRALLRVCDETGVQAIIATNTQSSPTPEDNMIIAGMGGGRLHDQAVRTVATLMQEKNVHGYAVDVIGCGGVQDRATYHDFVRLGIPVVQYWTALIYRGPLAAALIAAESDFSYRLDNA